MIMPLCDEEQNRQKPIHALKLRILITVLMQNSKHNLVASSGNTDSDQPCSGAECQTKRVLLVGDSM